MMLPGDLITFSGRVTGLKEGLIQLEIEAENQKGERVLTKGLAEVAAS
jgi:acyl dehydratase